MEATEAPEVALKYYAELLEADPTNAVCWVTIRTSCSHFFSGSMEAPHFDIPTNGQDRQDGSRTLTISRHVLYRR